MFAAGRPLGVREAYGRPLALDPAHPRARVELRRLAVDAETLLRVSDEFAESVRIPAGGHRLAPDGGGALAHLATVVFAVCLAAVVLLVVCLGVLLDTLLVRTVLVPALAFVLGDRFWWPGRIRDTPVEAVTVPA